MPRPRAFGLAGVGQPGLRILADHLVQPEAHLGGRRFGLQHGFVFEAGQQFQDRLGRDAVARADGLDGCQREAPGEDREPAEEDALPLREQLVAPADGRLQGPVARRLRGRWMAQQPERVVQPQGDLWGVRVRTCAAASSIARGMPSSRRQIRLISAALASVSAKVGRIAWPRSTKSRTLSHCPSAAVGAGSALPVLIACGGRRRARRAKARATRARQGCPAPAGW